MTDEFELSFKEFPLCMFNMLNHIAVHLRTADDLFNNQKYHQAHREISYAQFKMLELEKIEELLRDRQ